MDRPLPIPLITLFALLGLINVGNLVLGIMLVIHCVRGERVGIARCNLYGTDKNMALD